MEQPPIIRQYRSQRSLFPLWWVLVINALEFILTIQFYWVPRGTPIRPMAWSAYVFLLAVAGLRGVPMAFPTLRRSPSLIWPWLVMILAFTPYPLALGMYKHAERVRGFISEP